MSFAAQQAVRARAAAHQAYIDGLVATANKIGGVAAIPVRPAGVVPASWYSDVTAMFAGMADSLDKYETAVYIVNAIFGGRYPQFGTMASVALMKGAQQGLYNIAQAYIGAVQNAVKPYVFNDSPLWQQSRDQWNMGKVVTFPPFRDLINSIVKVGSVQRGNLTTKLAQDQFTQWAQDAKPSGFDGTVLPVIVQIAVVVALSYAGGQLAGAQSGAGSTAGSSTGTGAGTTAATPTLQATAQTAATTSQSGITIAGFNTGLSTGSTLVDTAIQTGLSAAAAAAKGGKAPAPVAPAQAPPATQTTVSAPKNNNTLYAGFAAFLGLLFFI